MSGTPINEINDSSKLLSNYTTSFNPLFQNKADDSPEIAVNYDDFKPTKGEYILMLQSDGYNNINQTGGFISRSSNNSRKINRIRIKRKN